MTTNNELCNLITRARNHGAIIRTELDSDNNIIGVQVRSGIPGTGPAWIRGLLFAADILREFVEAQPENDQPMHPDFAYAYNDNFQIIDSSGFCVGTEHNETEAKALVAYLNGQKGGGFSFKRNRPDQVRAAKEFNPVVVRHRLRDQAFEAMGIYR